MVNTSVVTASFPGWRIPLCLPNTKKEAMSDINTCRGVCGDTYSSHEFGDLKMMLFFEKGNCHYFLFKIKWSVYLFKSLNALSTA